MLAVELLLPLGPAVGNNVVVEAVEGTEIVEADSNVLVVLVLEVVLLTVKNRVGEPDQPLDENFSHC